MERRVNTEKATAVMERRVNLEKATAVMERRVNLGKATKGRKTQRWPLLSLR